jgi:hypothetical protein
VLSCYEGSILIPRQNNLPMRIKRSRYHLSVVAIMLLATHLLMPSLKAESVVIVGFGGPGKPPSTVYRLVSASKDQVECTLMNGNDIVEKGPIDYQGGFAALVADLIGGFGESTTKSMADKLDKFGHEEMRELTLEISEGPSSISFHFRGSLNAYGEFVRDSEKLGRALFSMSKNRPKMYRLWW